MTLTREQQREVFAHIFHNVFNQTTEKEQAHLERALVAQGINTVYDMLAMSDNAIESVRYVSGGDTINGKTLVLGHQGLIRVFKAFMKTKPVPNGKEAWEAVSKDDFDAYRVNPDHFAVAAPTMLSSNNAGNAVQSKRTPVDEFKRGIKRDASQFPVFKDEAKWDLFQRSMLATARSQGVENTHWMHPISQRLLMTLHCLRNSRNSCMLSWSSLCRLILARHVSANIKRKAMHSWLSKSYLRR